MTTPAYNAANLKIEVPRVITAEWLKQIGACKEQRDLFVHKWPDGAELTLPNVLTGTRIGLSLDWLVHRLLTAPAYQAYRQAADTAYQAYRQAADTASQAYTEAKATASQACREAKATASQAYRQATATAFLALVFADGDTTGGPA